MPTASHRFEDDARGQQRKRHLDPHFFPYPESVIWTVAAGKSFASGVSEISAGQGIAADLQSVEIAQYGHRDALRLEKFVRRYQYAFYGHCLDALNDFVHAEKAVVVHFLPRQVRHARRTRLQAQHQASLQLVLGAFQLFVGDGIQFQLAKLVHDGLHDLGGRLPRRAGVHRQQPGIAEGIQFGENRIHQPLLLANILEEPRTHASAQQRIQDVRHIAPLVTDAVGRNAHANLPLLQRFLVAQDDAGMHLGRTVMPAVGTCRQLPEALAQKFDKLLMVDVSCRRDDEIAGSKLRRVKTVDGILIEAPYRLLGSQDRLTQRMVLEEILGEDLMHQVVGIVLIHLDLFQDDSALADNLAGVEDWMQDHVA